MSAIANLLSAFGLSTAAGLNAYLPLLVVGLLGRYTNGSVNPLLAAISGVIIAGGTHSARATARPLATVSTAGIANPIISFFEDVVSLVLSLLAILVPVLAFLLVIFFAILMFMLLRRVWGRRRGGSSTP